MRLAEFFLKQILLFSAGFFSHGIAWVLLVLLVVAVLVMILLLGMLLHRWKTTPRCMCMIQAGSQASDFTRSSEDAADTTGKSMERKLITELKT